MTSAGMSYFLTRWFVNNTLSSTRCFSDTKVISNLLHTLPFWLNIVLHVLKLKIPQTHIPHSYTSQINFSVHRCYESQWKRVGTNMPISPTEPIFKLSLFFLPFQSESTIPDQILFFLKVQNCHLVSLIVLVPQWMLKWSKGSALDQ